MVETLLALCGSAYGGCGVPVASWALALATALVRDDVALAKALAAVAAGTSVVLAGHSNTERGFLRVLAERLSSEFGEGLEVVVADGDHDPLTVV